ncbi:hypothetical protein FB446DRAFT_360623 [Lentinula raphanica]|nr:hypothetical protein FB446DRAFT_360623 [Lentinula raphanica]
MPGRTWDKPVLLRAILSHPTVITVRVSGLLPKSNDDFSKVIFDHRNLWNPETDFFEQRLINGMKLSRLEIHSPHLLDTMPVDFGSRIFPGLEQIQFRMAQHCVSFSWLAALSSTHPHLNEFWLYDPGRCYFPRHVPPFISTFDEDSRHQGLKKDFFVTRVGLRRNINRPSEQD